MKKLSRISGLLLCTALFAVSCKKMDNNVSMVEQEVSAEAKAMATAAGFNTQGMRSTPEGYLIEGDILLTHAELADMGNNNGPELIIANEEHYRTTNTVSGTRTITVSLNTTQANFVNATNTAIARFNALPLRIKFQKVSGTSANINIKTFYQVSNTLGSAGFPSGGNPYKTVNMNTYWYTPSISVNALATTIAHEIGHCIGFRHTDYMNRSYSCGGTATNEGSAGVGAIHIPGTPTGASAGSWMLACSSTSTNRPFTSADQTALNYLY
ncbi:MAG: protease [Chitinophagaceae bacterium]|nr:MAG: protease [Chitinophagaceae bacterium]